MHDLRAGRVAGPRSAERSTTRERAPQVSGVGCPVPDLPTRSTCCMSWIVGRVFGASALLVLAFVGCDSETVPRTVGDHHGEGAARTSSALTAEDTVAAAVAEGCTTALVKGLATQLVGQIQCFSPGVLQSIEGGPGLSLAPAVFPYLQTAAAEALLDAQKARGETMEITSALRTLPQQYLLYRWYQAGRCGIALAAEPGKSNHESALAVDVKDNASWRDAMQAHDFQWLGASDPVHFDYVGSGGADLRGLSVQAFQRLWNQNHPEDAISEDGEYGPETEARLEEAPIGGFPIGPACDPEDGGSDAGSTVDGGGPQPDGDGGTGPRPTGPTADSGSLSNEETDDGSGCAVIDPGHEPRAGTTLLGTLGVLFALAHARRRRSSRMKAGNLRSRSRDERL